jgi:hypothetical protein
MEAAKAQRGRFLRLLIGTLPPTRRIGAVLAQLDLTPCMRE